MNGMERQALLLLLLPIPLALAVDSLSNVTLADEGEEE